MNDRSPSPLPESLTLEGESYEFEHQYKHDWLSAVGLYRGGSSSVILKCYRARSLWGLPVQWLTRRMAERESRILRSAAAVPGVPRSFGTWQASGILHAYLEGHPLQPDEAVRADFFDTFDARLAAIHELGIAYVDLSKRDNLLVGEDGLPCLIDFQIAWQWPCTGLFNALLPGFLGRWILSRLQRADRHHALKHRGKVAPESITDEERQSLERPAFPIRVHRFLARPYQKWRRKRQWARASKP